MPSQAASASSRSVSPDGSPPPRLPLPSLPVLSVVGLRGGVAVGRPGPFPQAGQHAPVVVVAAPFGQKKE